MTNKLGTCCIITDGLKVDNKGNRSYPAKKGYGLGKIQQTTLDKILASGLFDDHKVIKDNPFTRTDILKDHPLKRKQCYDKLTLKVKDNLQALKKCLDYISTLDNTMKMFRIGSDLLPMFDHPQYKALYDDKLLNLVDYGLSLCKKVIDQHSIIVTCHPDQFTVINSDRESVRLKSFECLQYHKYFMERLTTSNKTCINIHFTGKLDHIPELDNGLYSDLVPWLSFENDDTNIKAGVLPTLSMCEKYNIKMVYDVHHDLCENLGQNLAIEDQSLMQRIVNTWQGATPISHVSDSRDQDGATAKQLSPHSEYITSEKAVQFARELLKWGSVEVEAKAKQLAVKDLFNKI